MKNNILLILAVTIIALGIITAVIVISANSSPKSDDKKPPSSGSVSDTIPGKDEPLPADPTEEPEIIVTLPNNTTTATEATTPPETTTAPDDIPTAPEAEGIIATAKSLIGVPFAENGDTPSGFDNSGFIYYVLRENGYITCPRGVTAQAAMGTALDYDELKPGDLVYFYNQSGTNAGFGGIYIGGGKMISCMQPGTLVKEVDITTEYYRNNFYKGVSLS